MKFKKISFLVFFSLMAILYTGCDSKQEEQQTKQEPKKVVIPEFNLKTNDRKNIKIIANPNGWEFPEYKDKAILLNFFATWCPPCKAEIPHLNALKEKYKDQFEVIAILVEQNKLQEVVAEFIDEHKISYPIANGAENFKLVNAVGGVPSIPTMFLFNKNGKIINKYVGMVPQEMLDSEIQKALK
jgi:thiol-disulfide isomerase/thioredoxin